MQVEILDVKFDSLSDEVKQIKDHLLQLVCQQGTSRPSGPASLQQQEEEAPAQDQDNQVKPQVPTPEDPVIKQSVVVEEGPEIQAEKQPISVESQQQEDEQPTEQQTELAVVVFEPPVEQHRIICFYTFDYTDRGTSFRTFWGRVEELLVAGELWIDHKKLIFFPFFVYYDQCKPSPWSRPKAGGRNSRAWYHAAQGRRNPMKGVHIPGCDLGVDQVHASRGFARHLGGRAALKYGVRPRRVSEGFPAQTHPYPPPRFKHEHSHACGRDFDCSLFSLLI
ncbi:hypothetical protein Taro_005699 [Colocasia esculenta]|uniref:Uncharacterized protein n=1 Tax=Colocasia esculenta TaxID=4460 RepID=A0A843TT52_COLES|nr:hypothetical protein [Colocasia esculenta]